MTSYKTIADIKRAHRGKWFNDDSMRFFGSKIESAVLGGRYFVTSEDNFDRTERLFTVRYVDDDANIETVGEFNAYKTIEEAIRAAAEAYNREHTP